jgi:hypothetical protein
MAMISYQHDVTVMDQALVNRGANDGICGNDMLVLEGSERFVDLYVLEEYVHSVMVIWNKLDTVCVTPMCAYCSHR